MACGRPRPAGGADLPDDLRAASARDRLRGVGRQDPGAGRRRGLCGSAEDRRAAARGRFHRPLLRCVAVRPAPCGRGASRLRAVRDLAREPRARDLARSRDGARRGLPCVSHAGADPPLRHERDDRGGGIRLHRVEPGFSSDGSRTAGDALRDRVVRDGVGGAPARDWTRARGPDRRGPAAGNRGHHVCPGLGGERVGDPRSPHRRLVADPPDGESRRHRELHRIDVRPAPVAIPLDRIAGPRLGGGRERVARLGLQHDSPVRGTDAHSERTPRGRRPRRPDPIPAPALADPAPAQADPGLEPNSHHHLHPEHVRPHPAPYRRRARASD